MEYIKDCLFHGTFLIVLSTIGLLYGIIKNKDKTNSKSLFLCLVIAYLYMAYISLSDLRFYYEFKNNETIVDTINISYYDFFRVKAESNISSRRYSSNQSKVKVLLIKDANNEEYIIANDELYKDIISRGKIRDSVEIKYVKTHRYNVILDMYNYT